MPFIQPPVTPLPDDLDLIGQTAIVTGATAGIGLALARQLLLLKASTVVLAVRNTSKGETVKADLLADAAIRSVNPDAVVKVMKLDAENYDSVKSFTEAFRAEHQDLHIAMLNAGVPGFNRFVAPTGHESTIQVNYLSNVLLTLELLPLLEATAERTGVQSRVSWTGSRMANRTSLATKSPVRPDETVMGHLDAEYSFYGLSRYADSKLLVFLFLREFALHYGPEKVIVNAYCPGTVNTGFSDVLPQPFRLMADAMKAMRARSPEKAGWIGLHAAAVAGAETHGKQLDDKEIWEPGLFATSEESVRLQKMLWNETVDEMSQLTAIPTWMSKVVG
ncbi:short-chain dehydrogenase reductase family [Colletotrichum truncatum]|uniref:Short-chain dehydrogenase reductase family n=1 Tax=Colletotrichum truncatum TaxID=5467 RepID=A0ACC3YEF8_COLTU|nr:short-chain dehydrogenase reductase family [Colletotrichum truncatum]KAF6790099.1 short-chain dehydrogenase reductase family [Colletotrichum truncatum]